MCRIWGERVPQFPCVFSARFLVRPTFSDSDWGWRGHFRGPPVKPEITVPFFWWNVICKWAVSRDFHNDRTWNLNWALICCEIWFCNHLFKQTFAYDDELKFSWKYCSTSVKCDLDPSLKIPFRVGVVRDRYFCWQVFHEACKFHRFPKRFLVNFIVNSYGKTQLCNNPQTNQVG